MALLDQRAQWIGTGKVHQLAFQGRAVEYIEDTLADIAAANAIAHEVLGRSLDELPPQTRRVLGAIGELVEALLREQGGRRADVRFTRAQVRAHTTLSDTRCRMHLERLTAMEYLKCPYRQHWRGLQRNRRVNP